MRSVRSVDTGPEMTVRRAVHRLGFRFRLHRKDLPGCPDLVFPRLRIAIFVHGCFWHQHRCNAAARPTSRTEYWNAKLEKNIERDRRNTKALRNCGWKVFIIWECQTKNRSALDSRLLRLLKPNG